MRSTRIKFDGIDSIHQCRAFFLLLDFHQGGWHPFPSNPSPQEKYRMKRSQEYQTNNSCHVCLPIESSGWIPNSKDRIFSVDLDRYPNIVEGSRGTKTNSAQKSVPRQESPLSSRIIQAVIRFVGEDPGVPRRPWCPCSLANPCSFDQLRFTRSDDAPLTTRFFVVCFAR